MLRVFTDFDGPIIDVSERYYQVYKICLEQVRRPGQEIKQLAKPEFWQLKRDRVNEVKIGEMSGLDGEQALAFSTLRKKTVHTHPYFGYDALIPGATDALSKLEFAGVDIATMTMRRTSELEFALKQYDLGDFFAKNRRFCLGDDYVKTRDVDDKPLLMSRALATLAPAEDTWMVGDTEADIAAAKSHNIKVIAVESGIRSRQQIESFQPDFIVPNLLSAVELIFVKSNAVSDRVSTVQR